MFDKLIKDLASCNGKEIVTGSSRYSERLKIKLWASGKLQIGSDTIKSKDLIDYFFDGKSISIEYKALDGDWHDGYHRYDKTVDGYIE